ncbi:MAG TPA: hypothetical protein VKN99_05870, partial [Polyangia bacterium]|nr:hypothetical protein [Polyangia bacterium]
MAAPALFVATVVENHGMNRLTLGGRVRYLLAASRGRIDGGRGAMGKIVGLVLGCGLAVATVGCGDNG